MAPGCWIPEFWTWNFVILPILSRAYLPALEAHLFNFWEQNIPKIESSKAGKNALETENYAWGGAVFAVIATCEKTCSLKTKAPFVKIIVSRGVLFLRLFAFFQVCHSFETILNAFQSTSDYFIMSNFLANLLYT